jgi:hypothetical protein
VPAQSLPVDGIHQPAASAADSLSDCGGHRGRIGRGAAIGTSDGHWQTVAVGNIRVDAVFAFLAVIAGWRLGLGGWTSRCRRSTNGPDGSES